MKTPKRHLFTSEAVAVGHPDKLADQIADAVLDAVLAKDPIARVACEVLVSTGIVFVTGQITTDCYVDIPKIARETVREAGYEDPHMGFDWETCAVVTAIDEQSPDISIGVGLKDGEIGAGDQGIMIGYATDETPEYMPLPIMLARKMMRRLEEARKKGILEFLRPDGKCQVTVAYDERTPVRVHTVVLSAQHKDIPIEQVREGLMEEVIKKVIPAKMIDKKTNFFINPTGRFVEGGPKADTGLTGRKLIVDTYGGRAGHGGGSFSGKDPTKVDKSAAFMARYAAKNVVAAGLAKECEVQVAYAIGVPRPLAVFVDTMGTGVISDHDIRHIIERHFDFRPKAMIESLNLRRPIYLDMCRYGYFGREGEQFLWERLDKVEALRSDAGLK
ncbi:MAG: methionine adenosyltransferase [Planctomycetota bacterium]|nr:methionine adenosyltransferase [Planctomycetota bacterium]